MKLYDLNTGIHPTPIPHAWTSDKRFITYEYESIEIGAPVLPQHPGSTTIATENLKKAFEKLEFDTSAA